ncbi:hypothetical protein FGB62_166g032 [Gracilaria domingensis]|nr:hypothetical protein FGB62_166g032 [Gracilaria domingensis]
MVTLGVISAIDREGRGAVVDDAVYVQVEVVHVRCLVSSKRRIDERLEQPKVRTQSRRTRAQTDSGSRQRTFTAQPEAYKDRAGAGEGL